MGRDPLIVALVLLELVTLVALLLVFLQLRRTQNETRSIREQLISPQYNRAMNAAGWAVRQMAETAAKVRERGVVGGLLMAPIEDVTRWILEDRAEIDKVAAPDGTVTILFSDIEDSTALNERLGDTEWMRILATHDRLVREQIERRRGHVVKSQGDGFMVVFGDPLDAVESALAIQDTIANTSRRLRRTQLRVRVGIHCGPVVSREGDYFGRNVAMAARVAAQADGGQVLVSEDVRTALGEDPNCVVTPGERVELKGLAGSHTLWKVQPAPRRQG